MDAKEKRKLHRQKMKEEGKYHNKKKKPKKKILFLAQLF